MSSEFVELPLEHCAPFQLNVLLVSHLNQESFDPRKAFHDALDDGDDGWNSLTSGRLGHLGQYSTHT
jgi:hypothetical protein